LRILSLLTVQSPS